MPVPPVVASERRRFEDALRSGSAAVTSGELRLRLVVTEAPRTASFASEIAASVGEHGLMTLMARVQRVTGYDTVVPLARLEKHYIPSVARIVDGALKAIQFS